MRSGESHGGKFSHVAETPSRVAIDGGSRGPVAEPVLGAAKCRETFEVRQRHLRNLRQNLA